MDNIPQSKPYPIGETVDVHEALRAIQEAGNMHLVTDMIFDDNGLVSFTYHGN